MTDRLTSAQNERDRSRERFRASIAEARNRLSPARLRAEGGEKAREAISNLPGRIADAARERPRLTAGIAAGLAFVFLRKPIFGALRRLTKEKDDG